MAATESDDSPVDPMLQHIQDAVIVMTADLEQPEPAFIDDNKPLKTPSEK